MKEGKFRKEYNAKIAELRARGVTNIGATTYFECTDEQFCEGALKHLKAMEGKGKDPTKELDM